MCKHYQIVRRRIQVKEIMKLIHTGTSGYKQEEKRRKGAKISYYLSYQHAE